MVTNIHFQESNEEQSTVFTGNQSRKKFFKYFKRPSKQPLRALTLFLPLIPIYFLIIFFYGPGETFGDEGRYLMYAENLTNGFFTHSDNPQLSNGPIYPMIVAVFLKLGFSYKLIRYLNILFYFFAVVLLYNILSNYVPNKRAVTSAYLFGLYPGMVFSIRGCVTEAFTLLLISLFAYLVVKIIKNRRNNFYMLASAGLVLALILLTKYLFFYIVYLAIPLSFVLSILLKNYKTELSNFTKILVMGLVFTVPYFVYTYNLTGRYMYISTDGGEELYWMSSRLPNEHGSWRSYNRVLSKDGIIYDSHVKFYESIIEKSHIERDDLFKKISMERIKNNPEDYFLNVISNSFRLFFYYPVSNHGDNPRRVLFYLTIHIVPIVLVLIGIVLSLKNINHIPIEILALTSLIFIYLGLSLSLPAVPRYLIPTIPIIILWLTFLFSRLNNSSSTIEMPH